MSKVIMRRRASRFGGRSGGDQWAVVGALLLLVLASSMVGCGGRREVHLSALDVEAISWDTLRASVAFAARSAVGPGRDVQADSVVFRLFDADYRTLYAGPGPTIPVPDADLANREQLVLEACGRLESRTVCDQRYLEASPKRVIFQEDLDYPRNGRFDRGAYDFGFRLERQVFGADRWEPLPVERMIEPYLVASVDGNPESSVRVPLSRQSGQFDLTESENYPEFEYRMLRALERRRAVPVRIDVFAGDGGVSTPLASLERIVREKTRQQRQEELERFVRLASERLLQRFDPYDDARAHVRGWQYDPNTRRYDIRVRLSWGHLFFGRRIVEGELFVEEDGTNAVFVRYDMNREARRPWRQRIGRDRVALGTLEWEAELADEQGEATPSEIARRL